ncbi:flagellar basal-body MS-ring/collar protein FliF [Buchnera aphidicola (Ceratoglyphina bambusae)]|uniref:flagellar basal-body MS-ring/collar protein FliF n=1 Tax=Buchnera aphidicola TaxID=9 RepID=UPI0031B84430
MNDKLSVEKKSDKNFFFKNLLNLIKKNIIVSLIFFSFSITAIISILFLSISSNYSTLYNNLSDKDKNFIISELSSMNIPYKLNKFANGIEIPKKLIYKVRMNLSEKGIPKENVVGFEILDKSKFGESQFYEQVNYQRALEGELSKTIEKIDSIKNASVHIVLHSKSIFVNDHINPTASILLTLKFGEKLSFNKINAILHLVSKSVSGLKSKNITIVDQYGNFLNQSMDYDEYNNNKLIYLDSIEKKYKNKIEEILVPLFGLNNVKAQVTAQIDFDKKEKIEEKYKPNYNSNSQAIRSNQKIYHKEFNNVNNNVENEEDVLNKNLERKKNNLENKNKSRFSFNIFGNNKKQVQDYDKNKYVKKNLLKKNDNYNSNYDNTTNYELDHDIINTKMNTGNLKRISVGVVINYVKDSKGNFIPISNNSMKEIENLIKNSIGFCEKRGDTVDLVNSLFFNSEKIKEKNIKLEKKNFLNFFSKWYYWIILLIFIFILYEFLFKKVIFYFIKNIFITKSKNHNKIKNNKNKIDNSEEKNIKKSLSTSLINIDSSKKNKKNIFKEKSLFIAKVIQNWINKNE